MAARKNELTHFERGSPMPVSARRLFDWHAAPGAFERLAPPWERIRVIERSGGIGPGGRLVMQLRQGPLWLTWEALHGSFEDDGSSLGFVDEQLRGPFSVWRHIHRMQPLEADSSHLVDQIEYRLPLGALGRLVMAASTRKRLERMFAFRHERTRSDLARHAQFSDGTPRRVVISGASGMIGAALAAFLEGGGHRVQRLVRRASRGPDEISWDPAAGAIDARALEGADAIIHLAGANVAGGRWTRARKDLIRESRVAGTRLIAESVASLALKPRVLISASAVGYYGDAGETPVDESAPRGEGFLAEVCEAWEQAAEPARAAGIRVVHPRLGIVLSPGDGALAKLLTPFRLGVGGRVGNGRQGMSWVTLDDVVGALYFAMFREDLEGAVNVVSPRPVTNATFARSLGRVLRRPSFLPLPSWVVKVLFGEMGESVLLAGAFVAPDRLGKTGFRWEHPELEAGLRFMLGR